MEQAQTKEFPLELLQHAKEEYFLSRKIYSPFSPLLADQDKERLLTFHNFIKERVKKMFTPLKDGNVIQNLPEDFFDRFEFCYEDNPAPNACKFVELPDGKVSIIVTRGLLEQCEYEGELMAVVGHEIGHHLHRLIKPYETNNEAEEMWCDVLSSAHMPNAGYHPGNQVLIFEKINNWSFNRHRRDFHKLSPEEKTHLILHDPHPEKKGRDNINKLINEAGSHKYTGLVNIPLNREITNLQNLISLDGALYLDPEGTLLSNKQDLNNTAEIELREVLKNAERLQISLVGDQEISSNRVWMDILEKYVKKEGNVGNIEFKNTNQNQPQKYEGHVLNEVYWNKLRALNNTSQSESLIKPLWEIISDKPNTETSRNDLYLISCSILNRFLSKGHHYVDTYDNYYAEEQKREMQLPDSIVLSRQNLKEMIENPKEILPKFLSGQDTEREKIIKDTLLSLSRMVETGYFSVQNAEYLLSPLMEINCNTKNPFSDFVDEMLKYEEAAQNNPDLNERVQFLKNLVYTMGYYDTNLHKLDVPIHNLLDATNETYSYDNLNNNDLKALDSHSFFTLRNPKGCFKFTYDNRTKKIKDINSYLYKFPDNFIADPCEKWIKIGGIDVLITHYEHKKSVQDMFFNSYNIKTSDLNTRMHYKLKNIIKSFETRQTSVQDAQNLIHFYQHYMSKVRNWDSYSQILDFQKGIPLVIDGMDWSCNIAHKYTVSPNVAKEYNGKQNEILFDYFLSDASVSSIYESMSKKYIQLLTKGLNNTEIAQVFRDNFTNSNDGESFVLGIMGINDYTRLRPKKQSEYIKQVLSILNQEPYLSAFHENVSLISFTHRNFNELYQVVYQNAPDLCARIGGFYEMDEAGNRVYMKLPIQSFEQLKKMKKVSENSQNPQLTKCIMQIAHNQYLKDGHSDVNMEFSMDLCGDSDLNPLIIGNNASKDEQLKDAYLKNINNIQNWPTSPIECIDLMIKYTEYARYRFSESYLSDIVPTEVIQNYRRAIRDAANHEERINILSHTLKSSVFYEGKMDWGLSKKTTEEIFSLKGEHVWNKDLDENMSQYKWLSEYKALNGVLLKEEIAQHLINQLKQAPVEKQEEYSFFLLSTLSNISSPTQKEVLMDMWVQSVDQLIGSKDDMSDAYIQKVAPYSDKLLNKDANLALPIDTQLELSRRLQERLISQQKLSQILTPERHIGIFSNEDKTQIGGKLSKLLQTADRETIVATLNCLLDGVTPQNVDILNASLEDEAPLFFSKLDLTQDEKCHYRLSEEVVQRMYDEFWAKDFNLRVAILSDFFERGYRSKVTEEEREKHRKEGTISADMVAEMDGVEERIENMLSRILPADMEHRDIFYTGLKNYAEAVHEQEEYRSALLLVGCLAAAPKTGDNKMNMAKTIRKFLESQGAAGIKVGQFLCAHNAIPQDVREELKQLTNNATPPSRNEVFQIIRDNHPELIDVIVQQGGLGKCLGSASHYLTFELGDKNVLSVSRGESGAKAAAVYERLNKGIEKTLQDIPEQAYMLHIIRDAIEQANNMNDIELNANIGYQQACLATKLYDNVEMEIDGHHFTFHTMPWRAPDKETGPYHVRVKDGKYEYSQSFKIMEKAEGVDYDKIQNPDYKKAIAKANFLLNLRTILMGDVFDDDRHIGQLKVNQLSDKSTCINLFDTGSMSTEPPTPEELRAFGKTIYLTQRAITELQSDKPIRKKKKALQILFPHATSVETFFEGNGATKSSDGNLLFNCFNMAIDELRDENGRAPLYISKVERSLANLSHFSNDIPPTEIVPLVYKLFEKGHIHPEILNGISENASSAEKMLMQLLLPQGKFNMDLIYNAKTIQSNPTIDIVLNDNGPWNKRSIKTGNTSQESPVILKVSTPMKKGLSKTLANLSFVKEELPISFGQDNVSFIASLDTLLNPKIEDKEEQKVYAATLAKMCANKDNTDIITHLATCLDDIKSEPVKRKLSENMHMMMTAFLYEVQQNKTSQNISSSIVKHLQTKGLSQPFLDAILPKKQLKNLILRQCFIGGKLRFASKQAAAIINDNIKNFVEQAVERTSQIKGIVSSGTKMIATKPTFIDVKPKDLKCGSRTENVSNDVLRIMAESYGKTNR